MKELKLNIYKNQHEIEKTLTADGYDLMLGTCEDIMNIIDIDHLDDNKALALMVAKGYNQLKPLLKDIFDGLTDDDFRGIKIKELVPLIFDLGTNIVESLGILQQGNLTGAAS